MLCIIPAKPLHNLDIVSVYFNLFSLLEGLRYTKYILVGGLKL